MFCGVPPSSGIEDEVESRRERLAASERLEPSGAVFLFIHCAQRRANRFIAEESFRAGRVKNEIGVIADSFSLSLSLNKAVAPSLFFIDEKARGKSSRFLSDLVRFCPRERDQLLLANTNSQ